MMSNAHPKSVPVIPEINLNELPEDIVTKIYLDYFNYENKYAEIKNILDDKNSRSLNNLELTNYFIKENILKDVSFVQYLCEKNKLFNEIYKIHYIDKNKQFMLMNNLESMCQCWLMYLYH